MHDDYIHSYTSANIPRQTLAQNPTKKQDVTRLPRQRGCLNELSEQAKERKISFLCAV